jgi:CHAT domain-containing protein/Tfp pilus assembly protein PilF
MFRHILKAAILLACLVLPIPIALLAQQEHGPVGKGAGDQLLAQAREVYSQQGPQQALPLFEGVLAAYKEAGERLGESIVLGYIGNCHKHLGEYDKALGFLRQALAMKQELGARLETGKTLNHLGLLRWEMGDYSQAIERFAESLQIAKELDNQQLQGALLNNLSLVYDELGDYRQSLEQYERALALHRALGDRKAEGATLGNIGGVHYTLGNFRRAIAYYGQSYAISRELGLKPSQSQDLGNLAFCHLELDEIPQALKLLEEALSLAREAGLKKEEADWLRGRASARIRMGDYSDALADSRAAINTYKESGMKRELVEAREYLADLYLRLGSLRSSRRELQRARTIAESIGYKRGTVASLSLMGDLALRTREYDEALKQYISAYDAAQRLGDQAQMAHLLIQLGQVQNARGESAAAEVQFRNGLEHSRQHGIKSYEAGALLGLAEVLRRQGQAGESLPLYQQGIAVSTGIGNPELNWRLFHGQGRALEALGKSEQAITAYRTAVEEIESVRAGIREDPFRAGFMEDKYEVYVDLVRLLLKLKRVPEAFSYVEKSRARAYLDSLGNARIGADSPALAGRRGEERALRKKIQQLYRQLEQEHDKPRPQQRRDALETFTRELAEAQGEYGILLAELRSSDPEYASFVAVDPVQAPAVQNLLGPKDALLEYFLAENSLAIFLITEKRVSCAESPTGGRNLRAKIELFRDRLRRVEGRGKYWRGPAESLYELLIDPVERSGGLEGVEQLYIVPQGVLHYLPFAALWRSSTKTGEFLVERYRIASLPSASALRICRAKTHREPKKLLAMAPGSTGLQYAAEEARAVGRLFPTPGTVRLNQEASEKFCKRRCGDYSVLHFATHGQLNKRNPLFSHLDLAATPDEDGRLEVFEIMSLRLQANLVTLSACNTALGSGYFGELPAGDDWVGLTRAFMYAGTPTVVASLWEVDDRSTAELMKAFYRHLPQRGKAGALAQAQRDFLKASPPPQSKPGTPQYRHPYYWAGFVLIGDAQ